MSHARAPLVFDGHVERKRVREVIEIDDDSDNETIGYEFSNESESDDDEVIELPGPVATDEDGVPVYEVELISTTRVLRRGRQFKVKWRGFDKQTWKYEHELDGCRDAIYAYLQRKQQRARVRRVQ